MSKWLALSDVEVACPERCRMGLTMGLNGGKLLLDQQKKGLIMAKLKKRQKIILRALKDLGGSGTTAEIAELAQMDVNGVSQTLGALAARGYLRYFKKLKGSVLWRLTLKGIYTPTVISAA